MSQRTWSWILSGATVIAGMSWVFLFQSNAEAGPAEEEVSWSEDGRHLLHERLPSLGETESTRSEFVYDPVEGETLPSEIRRNGARFSAPSVTMQPIDGESVHTSDGLRGKTQEGRASPTEDGDRALDADRRMSFSGEAQPDRSTQKEGRLDYGAVFDPSIVPFKRNHSLNRVASDYELSVKKSQLRKLTVQGNQVEAGREIFWGSLLLEGDGQSPIPIPSVSPDSRILSVKTTPSIGVTFLQDAADNFYVRPDVSGVFRLVFVMDAGSAYFGRSLPSNIRVGRTGGPPIPPLPANVERSARRFNRALGLRSTTNYQDAIGTLVRYFRSFEPGEPPPPRGDIFTDLATGKKGICRHRSFAFVVAALQLGVPARYVMNEAHIFVEVWIPGPSPGWMRVDLGGGADELVVHNSQDKQRHRTNRADPFGGLNANHHTPTSLAGADKVSGLPSQPRSVPRDDISEGNEDDESKLTETMAHPVKRPDKVQGASPTQTTLKLDTAIVFRGDRINASGQVIAVDGHQLPAGVVQILLVNPTSGQALRQLATSNLDERGAYRAIVSFPRDLGPGNYEIIAEYMGGQGLDPSTSD